jgi:hypothetical protein
LARSVGNLLIWYYCHCQDPFLINAILYYSSPSTSPNPSAEGHSCFTSL